MPTSLSDHTAPTDLAVIGAGPAGLAAAVTAARLGLRVTLLDAADRPGGQYYRHPAPSLGATRPQALHHAWRAFAGREAALRAHEAAGRITYLPAHHVWTVVPADDRGVRGEQGWTLHAVAGHAPDETPAALRARHVLLATGAYERQLPFPGWTLPGVVGAGGAQAMLKNNLVLPGRRVVVAGSGPLLLAVAGSLAAAGAAVPAVVEAAAYTAYAPQAPALLRNPAKLVEGAVYGGALLRHGVRLLTRHAVTEAHGTTRVEAVTVMRLDGDWRPLPGTARRIPCDALAVGHGLVPQLELATGLGCATREAADGTPALDVDAGQRTSVPGIWSAGETGGIGGAELALTEGEIAAHAVAGRPAPAALVRRRARLRAFADAMAAAHRPGPGWTGWLREETDVCRCEEVPAGRIREAVRDLGARDARTVKLLTRAGMGWCQGRMCGPAVAALAGGAQAPDRRPLSCPVPLRHLAALEPQAPPPTAPGQASPDAELPTPGR
ncbi:MULTISPECIES: NAD(P)/FAD-dependent oxidoreductase [Streptomyces]|uniref:FAD/NAD(P)-dependent oxidoreductase n=1 Tax=Streptomyces TaxID=1883 RepID=UPI000F7B9B26|nr:MULTISPECIES: NAD(P)/FAD-dependent oxidoreductase [Streptomyces]RST05837.1 FAD-dependent oxidoreductase [Streptomyces sp. WAC07149]GLX21291.1 oxidase [Streptomyces lavendulae subsp. lavendulae]GLX27810.1 oxidase [Streptomyces lavendulae subsp. lavendulae]